MLLSTFAELSFHDKCGRVLLYATIVLVAIIALITLITKLRKPDKLPELAKYIIGLALGYAAAVIICMAFITFNDMVTEGNFVKELFYPILSVIITLFVIVAIGLFIGFLFPEVLRIYKYVALGIMAIPIIVTIVYMSLYYKNKIRPEGAYAGVSDLGLALSCIVLIIILIVLAFVFGKKSDSYRTKSMVYASVCIALSFALSYIRMFKLPQGGSITFVSLLPLMIYSKIFGTRKGIIAGLVYGIMQAIQDPWIIHPAQFMLDYPLAFGMIGISGIFFETGIFKKHPIINFALGGILASFLRYLCHALSGIFAFASYAPTQFNAVSWGFLYNTFVFADAAITIAVGCVLFTSKTFSKMLDKIKE